MPRYLLALVCALSVAACSCTAQQAAPPSSDAPGQAVSAALSRKIEIMIRSELGVPPDYNIAVGPREKSNVSGYDSIAVTFSLPAEPSRAQTVEFLLSKDGNSLARLSKWDIGNDPLQSVPLAGRPVRGSADAKVTIINFDDLECPYCARLNTEFFPDTLDRYKGLVKFIYIDFPLTTIHPWAMHAAVNANCLAAQSATAYWNYVDYLHSNGAQVSGSDNDPVKAEAKLDQLADQEGTRDRLDAAKLSACLAKQDESPIQDEMKAGEKLGVDSTPTFFVNGERWSGFLAEAQLRIMIDRALRDQGIAAPAAAAPPAAGATSAPGRGDSADRK